MAFDFKKEYKEFYLPKSKPSIVDVPKMRYIAVRGKGNPNEEEGEYKKAIGMLYAIAYTIKMSKMGQEQLAGYFDFVVPPLEGFWWQEGIKGYDITRKDLFSWIALIRVPEFVDEEILTWAKKSALAKKQLDCSKVELLEIEEGLCVQIMHIGPFDEEFASVAIMEQLLEKQGYQNDFSSTRLHHEIYLSDPRKCDPAKLKTVIRHPIKEK